MSDSDGVDHFRIVDGDRLMRSSPETTWAGQPERYAGAIARRIRTVFPALGKVAIAETFGGALGQTVHGMPQIGQLRQGLWVASGFSHRGLNTTAMAGQLIARGMYAYDDRFSCSRRSNWSGLVARSGGPSAMRSGYGSGGARRWPARWRGIANGPRARERIRGARLAEDQSARGKRGPAARLGRSTRLRGATKR